MTKRARYTTDEVLLAVDSDDEDDYDVDDPGEPFMDGSDEEFSDLDEDDDLDNNMDVSPPHSPLGLPPEDTLAGASPRSSPASASPPSSPASTSASVPPMWTQSLQPVNIYPFQSQTGPTVSIPESPLEVFQLLFTTSLMQMIVDESNR